MLHCYKRLIIGTAVVLVLACSVLISIKRNPTVLVHATSNFSFTPVTIIEVSKLNVTAMSEMSLPAEDIVDTAGPVEYRDHPECESEYFPNQMPQEQCISTERSRNFRGLPMDVVFQMSTRKRKIAIVDLHQKVLRKLWGSSAPSVDIYLRTGCRGGGFAEMAPLFESAELFWPNFLGHIVIVADAGDSGATLAIPHRTKHHYKIFYEYVPRLPGRLLNQYSYLHADKHCDAEYIVTIDSDCVFIVPVTPRFLFRDFGTEHMRIIVSSSTGFMFHHWDKAVNFFYKADMGGFGAGWNSSHGCGASGWKTMNASLPMTYIENHMVTQPVSFRRDTFARWRSLIIERNQMSFAAQLVRFYEVQPACFNRSLIRSRKTKCPKPLFRGWDFCWMCLIGNYIRHEPFESKHYSFVDWSDEHSEGTLFFVAHVNYDVPKVSRYATRAHQLILSGLCRSLGVHQVPQCDRLQKYWRDAIDRIMLYDHIGKWPRLARRLLVDYHSELHAAYDQIALTFDEE